MKYSFFCIEKGAGIIRKTIPMCGNCAGIVRTVRGHSNVRKLCGDSAERAGPGLFQSVEGVRKFPRLSSIVRKLRGNSADRADGFPNVPELRGDSADRAGPPPTCGNCAGIVRNVRAQPYFSLLKVSKNFPDYPSTCGNCAGIVRTKFPDYPSTCGNCAGIVRTVRGPSTCGNCAGIVRDVRTTIPMCGNYAGVVHIERKIT